jgi:hypothetical protein
MKLKEEIDTSICQEELLNLLSHCKKISNSINSHILIQDRIKTPPSSPMISDDIIIHDNTKETECLSTAFGRQQPDMNENQDHSENNNAQKKLLTPKSNISTYNASGTAGINEVNSSFVLPENSSFDDQSWEYLADSKLQTIPISLAENDQSTNLSFAEAEPMLEACGGSQMINTEMLEIGDQLASDILDEDLKSNAKTIGILGTIKGKISNVFSRPEESVQIETDSLTQNEPAEEVKNEIGIIASIKNRVGGFFYSQQDAKSDSSSSKYILCRCT